MINIQIFISLLLSFIFKIVLVSASYASGIVEIHISSDLKDIAGSAVTPRLMDVRNGIILRDDAMRDGFQYSSNVEDELLIRLLKFDINENLNDPKSISNFLIADPFYSRGTIFLNITPVKTDVRGSEIARNLFATRVSELPDSELPSFFQTARLDANRRMQDLSGILTDLHSYDVQSVYKYLQAVLEMSDRMYVLPPSDIDKARVWLQIAIERKHLRVQKAVGLNNAEQLLDLVNSIEGARYSKIWRNLIKFPCDRRLILLKSYRENIVNLPIRRKNIVISNTRIDIPTIDSSISQCLYKEKNAANRGANSTPTEILENDAREVLENIDEQISRDDLAKKVINRLVSDRNALNQIFKF